MLIDIGRYVGHHINQVSATIVLTDSWPRGTLSTPDPLNLRPLGTSPVALLRYRRHVRAAGILLGLEDDDKWHIFSNHPTLLIFQIFINCMREH